jgi:site-specific DNA-methyltransferase (adenine-specific)
MTPISWETTRVRIADLHEYDKNPRKMLKKDFDKLVRSIKEDGYRNRIVIDLNNRILGGHSRKRALLAAGYKEADEIEVLRSTRSLTEKEFERINIRDNIQFGEYDFDMLANNFNTEELMDWGLEIPQIDYGFPNPVKEEVDENKLKCELCGK